jgi:hypothetical protein
VLSCNTGEGSGADPPKEEGTAMYVDVDMDVGIDVGRDEEGCMLPSKGSET